MRTWPLSGVTLAVLWLFVRGVALEPAAIAGEFLLGLALGLPLSFVFRRLYSDRTDPVRTIRASPYALLYLLTFVWELLTANLDVAYRTLSPRMPIEPRVVVFPLRVETDLAITSIANSISLTPGTLTMDYDSDVHALYVHTLDGRDPEAVVAPIRAWEDYALVIFDEPGKPGDPVPGLPAQVDREARADRPATADRESTDAVEVEADDREVDGTGPDDPEEDETRPDDRDADRADAADRSSEEVDAAAGETELDGGDGDGD